MTDSPVVVQPLTASNKACTTVSCPAMTKGAAPAAMPYPQAASTVMLEEYRYPLQLSCSFFLPDRNPIPNPSKMENRAGIKKAGIYTASSG